MNSNDDEITERLTRVFRSVFREPDLIIQPEMTSADVENWDSLSHINLVAAVEKEFKIRFTTSEIMELKNVGDLDGIVHQKTRS
ncbi:MAG: acyl carrier protein [Acidobacteria bacterium]|nr:acyl carrier protein [Acidobacteriota bacterium]MBV9623763.1 acyl carrier protein [Acidobacteriota bacterium]